MTSAEDFVRTVRCVVGDEPFVGLHIPDITDAEKQKVKECLDSTFVSSVGSFVGEFEQGIAEFVGAGYAIAVSNGTSALQVALELAGVVAGDDVIVPALSFVATANAVSHAGAQPYFVDSDEETLGLSVEAVGAVLRAAKPSANGLINAATGRRIGAIVPMHTLGHPMRIAELVELADSFGIPVVEDAAESLGSRVGSRHTGTFGILGILSFNGNKILTTGGGGIILTDDEQLARRARHLTTTAKLAHRWEFEHDEVAYNFRMPNLNAALGVAQLERLPEFLTAKRRLATRYQEAFDGAADLTFLAEPEGTESNYWLCAVRTEGGMARRDELLEATNDAGLQCRPFWNLLHRQAAYRHLPHAPTPVAEALHASAVCIPSSPALARA
ncbi:MULTISPECIES: LegC family aminotransferase [unclassified Microbacterium]|uniref:LegC family aminotransferase n=1 Tax=unclassified Microbacterium TaxID=2609290 RepID=UPI000EA8BEBC|nr:MULTISPECIES: LegC family aminotransferase [unclassified Microbacterium]MBT2485380.1 LegC family aminotransferase [Microbacterium sp. ISL-108]RKN68183.1 LegC family aminotransferase [Microbacterium sp. CGR2]